MILCKTRKFFAVVFAAVTVLTFNACGDSSAPTNSYATANRSVTEDKNVTNAEYVTPIWGDNYSGLYTGEWSNEMPNGEGSFNVELSDGSFFATGTWVNGKLNGYAKVLSVGEIESENGKISIEENWDGEWKNGNFDGSNCKLTRKFKLSGQVGTKERIGTFSQNKFIEGKEVTVSNDGNTYTYEGTFEDGKILNGTEHVDCSDGRKLDFNGSFSNGAVWNGTLTETLKNGTTRQTTVTNGEPEDKGILESLLYVAKGGWDGAKPVVGPVIDAFIDELFN